MTGPRAAEADAQVQRRRSALRRRLVPVVLMAGAFTACDSPPPMESLPLAVIATSSVQPDQDCLLNFYDIGAGSHPVEVITEQAPADVRITDEAGGVVFEGHGDPGDLQDMPAPSYVQFEAGVYTVRCMPEGGPVSATELRVLPARPGYESLDPVM